MHHNLIEQLEPRLVLSAPTFIGTSVPIVSLHEGTLTIRGTSDADQISFTLRFGPIPPPPGEQFEFLIQLSVNGQYRIFKQSKIQRVLIDGGAGDDLIKLEHTPTPCSDVCYTFSPSIPAARIRGGAGNDTIVGGEGDDTIDGGSGDDVIYGAGGNDIIFAKAGNDRIEGGEGLDHVSGGSGFDRANDTEKSQKDVERITKTSDYTPPGFEIY
jgi:Ca2+-binding RTX toxin-like protein